MLNTDTVKKTDTEIAECIGIMEKVPVIHSLCTRWRL